MELVKLGKKGQISIPRSVLRRVGIDTATPMLVDTTSTRWERSWGSMVGNLPLITPPHPCVSSAFLPECTQGSVALVDG